MHELRKIYFATENAATKAFNELTDAAHRYGSVSVPHYYEIFSSDVYYGIDAIEYGWTYELLKEAHLRRDYKLGWYIKLPNPIKLYTSDSTDETPTFPAPDILNITIHTNELEDPEKTLSDIFKHILSIKERMINITVM